MNPGTSGLERGLAVLEALASGESSRRGGLGVVRLAELVGSDKSQTSRTLVTLAEHGLVERDPDTLAYRVGWQVYALAARAASRACSPPAPRLLRGLVRDLGESAHLSVRQGASVLTLALGVARQRDPRTGARGLADAARHHPSAGRALAFDLAPKSSARSGSPATRADRGGACARLRDRARGVRAPVSSRPQRRCATAGAASWRPSTSRPRPFASARGWMEAATAVVAAAAELSADLGAPRQSAA